MQLKCQPLMRAEERSGLTTLASLILVSAMILLASSHGVARSALRILAHDVPFAVDNLQRVCKLRFETMVEEPHLPYGADDRSHYQGQLSTLSKHFRVNRGAGQLTFSRAATGATTRVRRVQSQPDLTEQDVTENRLEAL